MQLFIYSQRFYPSPNYNKELADVFSELNVNVPRCVLLVWTHCIVHQHKSYPIIDLPVTSHHIIDVTQLTQIWSYIKSYSHIRTKDYTLTLGIVTKLLLLKKQIN